MKYKFRDRGKEIHEIGAKEAVKGALLWGGVYSASASGAAYIIAPMVADAAISFSEIFTNALCIFPASGAVRGWLMWRFKKNK